MAKLEDAQSQTMIIVLRPCKKNNLIHSIKQEYKYLLSDVSAHVKYGPMMSKIPKKNNFHIAYSAKRTDIPVKSLHKNLRIYDVCSA